jgi:uncharacterized membrane protein YiaA
VLCPDCNTEQEFADGRCAGCGAASAVRCPKCRGWVAKGEKFCSACGAKIPTRADRIRAANRNRERQETQHNVNRGRRWMLVVAVLTLFGGVFSYFAGMSDVDKQLREAEAAFSGMTPVERDAQLKKEVGMTWQEVVDHDRGMVTFQMAVLVALGVIYIGLWWWAQTNAFAAALIALLLFVTVMLVSALIDPVSLVKGIIIKIVIIGALSSAVSSGYRQRAQQRRRLA